MSAFIVSEKHLQTLVNWAMDNKVGFFFDGKYYDLKDPKVPETILTVLYRQNVRSVDSRYKEKNVIDSLKFKRMIVALNPVDVLKACHCLEYQSCETDDYERSFAYDIIIRIKDHAIRLLPGYEKANWAIK